MTLVFVVSKDMNKIKANKLNGQKDNNSAGTCEGVKPVSTR